MHLKITWVALVATIGACVATEPSGPVAVTGCLPGGEGLSACEEYSGREDPTCFEGSDLGVCCPRSATRDGMRHLDECVLSLPLQGAQTASDGTCTVRDPHVPGLCETVSESGPISLCLPVNGADMPWRCVLRARTFRAPSSP